MSIYPEYAWDVDNDASLVYQYISKYQLRVFKLLQELCPHVDIHTDYLHPGILDDYVYL